MLKDYMDLSPEVSLALAEGRGVVALESTIIAHGMPFPQNVETARRVEDTVRDVGAVPATIAIVGGRIRVGLDDEALQHIGSAEGVCKVSRRDFPTVVARGLDGATTVAGTLIAAEAAGIRVFATGGIGGVHRGAGESFDVSADLPELARASVAVVCAGAKSILDLGATLEFLETWGVPVLGFGTDELPAFFCRTSGFAVDERIDDVRDLARLVATKWDLGLSGGVVVANPIPEEHALDTAEVGAVVDRAIAEAKARGLKGKELTPFLLDQIRQATGGESLKANIELVLSNARLAGELARELAA
jgi:pseudouridine-5'-phosphate glycosidase